MRWLTLLQSMVLLIVGFGSVSCSAAGLGLPAQSSSKEVVASQVPSLTPGRAVSATPSPSLPPSTRTPVLSTSTSTAAPIPTSSPTEAAAPQVSLPAEYYIDITGHRQFFSLGCETAAAKDWADYFGWDFNEFEFQYHLPISDNPDYGFVGDVDGPWGQVPPYAYGVYAGPIADLLNAYGVPAKAYKGYTLEQLEAKLAGDVPVIVWVIGNVEGGLPSTYIDTTGRPVVVAAYEHVVIATGYNEGHIRYMNNGKFYDTPTGVFLNSWGVLGNMVVVDR